MHSDSQVRWKLNSGTLGVKCPREGPRIFRVLPKKIGIVCHKIGTGVLFLGSIRGGNLVLEVVPSCDKGKFHGLAGTRYESRRMVWLPLEFVVDAYHSSAGDFSVCPKPIQHQRLMGAHIRATFSIGPRRQRIARKHRQSRKALAEIKDL